ncbi:Ger(x)C family spore germination protein [Fictibacillus nanhaiensis]|uniref:Ger(x)C family spore germination protein n=1 Tax=Fictibacillus nanhaiensis TaxID=742169 RepID=UPI00203E4B1E|nr:Ger(x)C family spore germination protein [Fictibacillus nanhaiensis]MCM3730407.1 Ger(x)C family spore germination protein [Fictibacillus nanhaiensis]
MMNNKFVKRMGCVALSLFLSGCIPKSIIDEVSLMHYVGFDREKKMLKASVVYPNYATEGKSTLLTAIAKNPSSLQNELGHKSEFEYEVGQVRVMIFGDKLSRYGLVDVLDTICKDPKIGVIRMVISDGSPDLILKKTLNKSPLYLKNLIDKSIEDEGIPDINLHVMYDQYFGSGIDMSLPNLKLDSKGNINIDGMGIFKGDKLKFRISNKEAFLLKLMIDRNKSGVYSFNFDKNGHKGNIGVRSLYGKHKVKVIKEDNQEKAKMDLTLNIKLEGLPKGVSLEKERDLILIKKALQKSISTEAESLLKDFQANGVDPVGLGRIYKINHRNYSEQNFYKRIYRNMKFDVNTKIIVRQTGVGNIES